MERKKKKFAPGEMENLVIKKDVLNKLKAGDEITVAIEEV